MMVHRKVTTTADDRLWLFHNRKTWKAGHYPLGTQICVYYRLTKRSIVQDDSFREISFSLGRTNCPQIQAIADRLDTLDRRWSVFSKISIRKITYSHVAQKSPVFNILCILSRRHRLNDDHNAPDLPPHWQPISLIFVMHIYILLRVVGAIDRKLTTVNGLENNNNKYLRIDTTKNTPYTRTRGFGSTAVCSVVLEHRGRW